MNETVRVAKAEVEPTSIHLDRTRVLPREELPVLFALLVPGIAAALVLPYLPGNSLLFTIPVVNAPVPIKVAVLVLIFFAAYLVGSTAAWRIVIRPSWKVADWLSSGRASRFVSMPPVPDVGAGALQELEREIAASVAVFSSTSVHNEALSKQKSEILMVAAHQLHTPMTEVRWGVEQLLDPATTPALKEELTKNISRSLRRLSSVVDNIVASSDIDTDAAGYVFEPIDLVELAEKAIKEFELLAQERTVKVVFQHADVPRVRGDVYRLSSVFFNLLSNAIGYTPAGGTVTVTLEAKAAGVECTIADTGIGIPEKDLPMLFSKFHRGEHAKHMRPDGSGLGLYLVKNILNRHGADVVVRSKDGAGTTVSFMLPLAQPAKNA